MDDVRINLLDQPAADAPYSQQIRHELAKLLAANAKPVIPNAERSTHPAWDDYDRLSRILRGQTDGTIVAVYTITDVEWSEFVDTDSQNDEHFGIAGEAVAADGWTGRVYYERPFHELLRELTEAAILD